MNRSRQAVSWQYFQTIRRKIDSKILVSVDLGDDSSCKETLPTAVDQAQHTGGELHIVTVVPEEPPRPAWFPDDYSVKMISYANSQLAKLLETNVPEQRETHLHVCQGSIYSEIVKPAKDIGIDLIVMASHRPELKDHLLGRNAARVVRHAGCPI